MGFGWLLIGYFFVNMMSLYSPLSFAMLAGYPMMIFGLRGLAPYHTRFRYCYYVAYISLPFALYFALYGFSQIGFSAQSALFGAGVLAAIEICYFFYSLLFHGLLLFAIASLTGELGLVALQGNAWRNLVLVGLFYLIDGVMHLPISVIESSRNLFSLSLILLRLCFILLNMYLIFKCYRLICPEGDETMPERRSLHGKERDKEGKK